MSSDGTVTYWLTLLKAGDLTAAQPLWERYFPLLVARARAALGPAPRRAADEEDVALNAFDSFCRGAARGRFPRLNDRNDLWRLLLTLTVRKAANQARDERRIRRGGGKVTAAADLQDRDAADAEPGLTQVISTEPTPEIAALAAEEFRRLLDRLGDAEQRNIAVWQMEGYTADEIAARLGCSVRTVARKLVLIRERWRAELPMPPGMTAGA